ncbi:FxsA family protein [Pseudomaricurvus sp. HS19]|uniref:FxsA family protein n=1 Tax=Pseudomaricurvus sp. HS19 TaxID=2692626 RepID=UPI00136CFCDD|nr:FxsA family protein [Pseudomaricurvus sp. HS19]MYM64725.1 FxsA family protein [Pseudomaricurvus sp. HS19]
MPLLIIFVILPILEMWLLIAVGSRIGALPTIGLVLLTAMIGLALLRRQGARALVRANKRMNQGEIPIQEMVEGIFLAVGGALLLTPGFFTDALGFACLIPGLRQLLIGRLLRPVIMQTASRAGTFYHYQRRPDGSEDIIEGEFYQHRDPSDPADKRLR